MIELGTFTFAGSAGPIEGLYKPGSELPARAAVPHTHPRSPAGVRPRPTSVSPPDSGPLPPAATKRSTA